MEAGVVQATRTAPSETQEARSRTEEGISRLDALTIWRELELAICCAARRAMREAWRRKGEGEVGTEGGYE